MKLYFIGICGSAMGQIALLMKRLGHEVCGSDRGVYPPMSDLLLQNGVGLFENPSHVVMEKLQPDLVIVGNVVARGHEEIEWLLATQAFPYCSMSELIRRELIGKRRSIVVAGTHGKSTTASLVAHLLKSNGSNPGYMIGGVPKNFEFGAQMGDVDAPFVTEGDEYDTAFFDKRSKFIHYNPQVLVLNNVEFDHADIFRDLQDVQRTFSHLIRLVPRNGCIVVNEDSPHLMSLVEKVNWAPVVRVGESTKADLRIMHFAEDANGSEFELHLRGILWVKVRWSLTGMYNARNAAMAAMGAAYGVGSANPERLKLEGLSLFQGVSRRQDVLYCSDEVKVIEDFGHHPTAIRETLTSFRNRYPKSQIVACFEPRSNSTCRRVFQKDLIDSLALADCVLLSPVYRPEKLEPEERLNLDAMCRAFEYDYQKKFSRHYPNNDELFSDLKKAVLPMLMQVRKADPVIVVFFSNGAFGGIMPKLVEHLKAHTGEWVGIV